MRYLRYFLSKNKTKNDKNTIKNDMVKIAKALNTSCGFTWRSNTWIRSRLRMVENSAITSRPKVVVLIPPPVDPGEAPINIKININHREAILYCVISCIEKPAVRDDTE